MYIVQTGNCDQLTNSQRSIYDMMQKIKIKGTGRPKKRQSAKNPFKIGKCQWCCTNIFNITYLFNLTYSKILKHQNLLVQEF